MESQVHILDSDVLLPVNGEVLKNMESFELDSKGVSAEQSSRREMLIGDTFNGVI